MQPAPAMVQSDSISLTAVLDSIRKAARGETLSVRDVLSEIGDRSFATAVLVPALILVSPLSGIPGVPTIGGIIVMLVAFQWLAHRDHLWLPEFIMRRRVRSDRMLRALTWFDRPAAFIDRHAGPRLTVLADGPLAGLPLVLILAIAATWPLLEILPFVTTIGAFAVSLFAFGLMMRDGVWVLSGYLFVAALGLLLAGIF